MHTSVRYAAKSSNQNTKFSCKRARFAAIVELTLHTFMLLHLPNILYWSSRQKFLKIIFSGLYTDYHNMLFVKNLFMSNLLGKKTHQFFLQKYVKNRDLRPRTEVHFNNNYFIRKNQKKTFTSDFQLEVEIS